MIRVLLSLMLPLAKENRIRYLVAEIPLSLAIKRSKPYGSEGRVSKAVAQFGLENTVRNPWRPGKGT